ncbi:MAG: hypothetical protein ACLFN7_01045 [Candidatus Acetothermia bacterium]
MSEIDISTKEENKSDVVFVVKVKEEGSESSHRVTLKDEDFNRMAPGETTREKLVEESFRFLLEREPKESILGSFDLTVIGNYFPEYEEKIKERLK